MLCIYGEKRSVCLRLVGVVWCGMAADGGTTMLSSRDSNLSKQSLLKVCQKFGSGKTVGDFHCFGLILSYDFLILDQCYGDNQGERRKEQEIEVLKSPRENLLFWSEERVWIDPAMHSITGVFIQAFLDSELHIVSFQNLWISGVPGWLSQLSVQSWFQLRSWSYSLWDWVPMSGSMLTA